MINVININELTSTIVTAGGKAFLLGMICFSSTISSCNLLSSWMCECFVSESLLWFSQVSWDCIKGQLNNTLIVLGENSPLYTCLGVWEEFLVGDCSWLSQVRGDWTMCHVGSTGQQHWRCWGDNSLYTNLKINMEYNYIVCYFLLRIMFFKRKYQYKWILCIYWYNYSMSNILMHLKDYGYSGSWWI